MQAFKKVDMESWPRREHYRYYTEALKVEFNMTAPVDDMYPEFWTHEKLN